MKKPLRFSELSETAKETAADKVYEKEAQHEEWDHVSDDITSNIHEQLKEAKLDFGDIPWESHYGVTVDLSSVTTGHGFYESILTKEQMDVWNDLDELSELEETVYPKRENRFDDDVIFTAEGDFTGLDPQYALPFLKKYAEEDEVAEFAFIELLEEDLTDEQEERLQEIIEPLVESELEALVNVVVDKLYAVREKIVSMISSAVDYHASPQYYSDNLNAEGSYEEEKYRFNETGDIVSIDEVIVDEFEAEYEAYVASLEEEEATDTVTV